MRGIFIVLAVLAWPVHGAVAVEAGRITPLADFEPGHEQPFQGGVVEEGALRVDGGAITIDQPMDWSAYDFLHIDARNPGDKPVQVWIEVRDAETQGYWTRANVSTLVPPGRSVLSLPTGLYVGEKSRPGRGLHKDRITRFAISLADPGPVFFDDFRFETLDTAAYRFPGLTAFDFGPAGAPVLEGFTGVATQRWDDVTGFGWLEGSRIWRTVNALQPEPLAQDFVCPEAATFRVRVSNGVYRVGFNITSPNGYWGETQAYRNRRVAVNGRTALEGNLDFPTYLSRYFQHAGHEDLPGVSAFDEYVRAPLAETWVTTEVTNGFLDLEFSGKAWALCFTHLIAYPAGDASAGERFCAWALERRRFHFDNYFKMMPGERTGALAPASGVRLFKRHFMDAVGPLDGPRPGEEIGAGAGLQARAARGEEVAVTLAAQPAAGGVVPPVRLAGSLCNAGGKALEGGSLELGWIDYRLARVAMDGSIYDIRPRYWRTGEPPSTPGITRNFWLRWQPAPGTPPGVYTGAVVVAAAGAEEQRVPLSLEVLPFDLAPVEDLAVGPWGSGIGMGWFGDDPATHAWDADLFDKSLVALRRHGFTSLSGRPHLRVDITPEGLVLDTAQADLEMAKLREHGFHHLISSYGIQKTGYSLYQGPTADEIQRAGYTSAVDFLAAFYQKVERHAQAQDWLPVAWNLCDEPIGADIPPAVSNALLHRAASAGLQKNTFMGATSMRGDDPADAHYALVQALPMPTLTLHDEPALGVVKAAGNQFAYYNGGDRWTYGRYMKMLEDRHDLKLRMNWHFNVAAGDPYYALDCREDDYCWYNSNDRGELVPSLSLLQDMVPGLNDYRLLLTLENLLERQPEAAGAAGARRILENVHALRAGDDAREGAVRLKTRNFKPYDQERDEVLASILALLGESGDLSGDARDR